MTTSLSRDNLVDAATLAAITVDFNHYAVQAGKHYYVAGYATFAADEDIDFQVTTPNTTTWAHMLFEVVSTGATTFKIYETAAVGSGSGVTAINNNRNSTNTSGLTIQTDGAVNTTGSLIYSQAFGYTNTPSKSGGGEVGAVHELILKQNTTYRFFIESDSADNIISYMGTWYEHANAS